MAVRPARNEKRSFRQAVAREKSFAAESDIAEDAREPVDRVRANGFSAIEHRVPCGQVQAAHVVRLDAFDTEVEREIRCRARRRAVLRHRLEPAERALEE